MKKYVVVVAALLFVSCSSPVPGKFDGVSVTGDWVMPVPGQPGKVQGVRLEDNGKASSINMATLVYESWKREGDGVVVSGKSVGNGQTLLFEEKLIFSHVPGKGAKKGQSALDEVLNRVQVLESPDGGRRFVRRAYGYPGGALRH